VNVADEGRSDLRIFAVLLGAAFALLIVLLLFGGPMVEGITAAFDEGVGLKTAAVWSFFTTVALFVLFAVVAGDGLIGEIQFMLGAFFTFFAIITLLIAWVF
jgi:hypothetical protein